MLGRRSAVAQPAPSWRFGVVPFEGDPQVPRLRPLPGVERVPQLGQHALRVRRVSHGRDGRDGCHQLNDLPLGTLRPLARGGEPFVVAPRLRPPDTPFEEIWPIAFTCVLFPLPTWAMGLLFGVNGFRLDYLVLIAAMPAPQNLFIFAQHDEFDAEILECPPPWWPKPRSSISADPPRRHVDVVGGSSGRRVR